MSHQIYWLLAYCFIFKTCNSNDLCSDQMTVVSGNWNAGTCSLQTDEGYGNIIWYGSADGAYLSPFYNFISFVLEIELTIDSYSDKDGWSGMIFRVTSANVDTPYYYYLGIWPRSNEIKFAEKYQSTGSAHVISSYTVNTGVTYKLKLEALDETYYNVYLNDNLLVQKYSNANHDLHRSGSVGLRTDYIATTFSSFVITQTTNNPTPMPTYFPTTLRPTTAEPTVSPPTAQPTTNYPSIAPLTIAHPTAQATTNNPTTNVATNTNKPPNSTDTAESSDLGISHAGLQYTLLVVMIIMLCVFAMVGFCAWIYSIKCQRSGSWYSLKMSNLFVFAFEIYDFVTDSFFVISCYHKYSNQQTNDKVYLIIFCLSLFFIVCPSIVNLILLNRNIKYWITDPSNGKRIALWLDSYLLILYMVCFISGNSKASIKLFTSNLFGLKVFSLQLKPSQYMKHANQNIMISLSENVPQVILDIVIYYFVYTDPSIKHLGDIVIIALLFNIINTIITFISLFARKTILKTHGMSFDEDHMSIMNYNKLSDSLL